MQLLSALYSANNLAEEQSHLPNLIPRLFPFFRHTLASVRKAAVTCCALLLADTSSDGTWLTAKSLSQALQLTFQALIVETEQDIIDKSKVHPYLSTSLSPSFSSRSDSA